VVPSVYPDPLPRAVLESMAMGKPVIAFDVGGIAEMLGPGEGTLLPGKPADVTAMAMAFVRYFRDPALRARQGRAAAQRAVRDFSARTHAARIEAEILAAARRPRRPARRLQPPLAA
jgi:glycosyltransferase involved in cell wall biosynthesis